MTNDKEREIHYLIDRKNDYWYIHGGNLHFPLRDQDAQTFHTQTLVDGELVLDDLGDGRKEPKFLVFDCLVLDGKNLMERPLDKRLGYFGEEIMRPYEALFKKYPEELTYQAFRVEMKSMQVGYGVEMMFREVLPKLRHGNDGLIFTCRNTAYQPGTDQHIMKWKPLEENTVDFRLRLRFHTVEPTDDERAEGVAEPFVDYDGWPDPPEAELYAFMGDRQGPNGDGYAFFAPLHLPREDWEILRSLGDPLENRVVECAMDEQHRWLLHRFRDDKHEANHISTVKSVMESVRDGVSQKELIDAAKGIRDSWKSRQAAQQRK